MKIDRKIFRFQNEINKARRRTTFLFFCLVMLSNICNAQLEKIDICKIDSSSQRVFIYATRQEIKELNYVKRIIKEIEDNFHEFDKLNISFFDDMENCGYKVETKGDSPENFEMKTNDVKSHWIAEYSSTNRILKIYQQKSAPMIEKEIKIE